MKFTSSILVVICCNVLLLSCSSEKQTGTDKEFFGEINNMPESIKNDDSDGLKIYTLPTPLQVSSAIKMYGYDYKENILFSTHNKSSPSSLFNNALCLGIYTIDLGYTTVYDRHNMSLKYIESIKELMGTLGISGNKSMSELAKRFENNVNNKDSLYRIILESYNAGHQYFIDNKREGMGLLILTGCYLEGLYLTLNSDHKSKDCFNNLIGQQKLFLDNIIELLDFYSKSEDISSLISQLNLLKSDFDKIQLDFKNPSVKPFVVKEPIDNNVILSIKSNTEKLRKQIAG